MTNTLDGFCRDLLDDESFQEALDPEHLAARFVHFFGLSDRPALDELTGRLTRPAVSLADTAEDDLQT